ncbi:MAG TPA: hypothetical protein VK400_04015, partial [Pyrinomonadaceae bacterium]|nr:hypothetical protein [Pyrinomonadaceae bacterium]
PLQLVVERGLPALLIWLWILWLYSKILRRGLKALDSESQTSNSESEISNLKSEVPDNQKSHSAFGIPYSAIERGILLGSFGGLIGFIASGLVHYNLGDQEVAMIFFLLMGLSVRNGKRKMDNGK